MADFVSLADDRESALDKAAVALRAGGLCVFPTDTVYGVGADAFQPFATSMLFQVKGRPRTMALPVMVSAPRQAWALATHVPQEAAELAAAFWPGALTLVLEQAEGLSWDLGDVKSTIAIRIPANADARDLIARVGPMAVTSANPTGEPTPATAREIAKRFGLMVAVYLDGGAAPGDVPSTIVDLTGRKPVVKREGAIPRSEIERILGKEAG